MSKVLNFVQKNKFVTLSRDSLTKFKFSLKIILSFLLITVITEIASQLYKQYLNENFLKALDQRNGKNSPCKNNFYF